MGCSLTCRQPLAMLMLRHEQTISTENVQYLSDSSMLNHRRIDKSVIRDIIKVGPIVLTDGTSFRNL